MDSDRSFLKSLGWDKWRKSPTDQKAGLPAPPIEKPAPSSSQMIKLVPPEDFAVGKVKLFDAIRNRKSHRKYLPEALTLEELSFLLWATQGIREITSDKHYNRRNVPSGGSRHPFETYLLVNRVTGVPPGLYRYLPVEHQLCFLFSEDDLVRKIHEAAHKQYIDQSAVTFIWTVIPYRSEWRYTFLSPKIIALDAGHLCQNLYLACEGIQAGTCAIGAYDQAALDQALHLDGEEEFVIYLAPVGKVRGTY